MTSPQCLLTALRGGTPDRMEVLEKWDTDAVMELGRQRLEEAGDTGFILGGTASGTYTEKAAENFIALVEVAEEMRDEG